MINNIRKKAAVTLIELLVVISIIGLLSTIVISSFVSVRADAVEKKVAVEAQDQIRGIQACGLYGRGDPTCVLSENSCSELNWHAVHERDVHDLLFQSCGESDASGLSCNAGVTWFEAKDLCEGVGARLCTIEELENDITQGTGCSFDNKMNWSMSACDGDMYIGKGADSNGQHHCQQDLNDTVARGGQHGGTIAVRCCADY
jgi:prepilin-type N-terminal cleavage/methylation domain-containing protein